MNKIELMTDKELEEILITCDGKGKEIKSKVLAEIRLRQFIEGQNNIVESQNQ